MIYLFEWLGLIFIFILGFAEGMITPSTFFRLLTILLIPFAIGIPLYADMSPFGFMRLMFWVPCAISAAGFGSLLGEIFRRRLPRGAESSPERFHAPFFQPSPRLPMEESGPFDGRHCVACRASLKAGTELCPECGWTQPTSAPSAECNHPVPKKQPD
jgi:hypothetical protein